ncbi:hypothetical protein ON010_g518 [Phytophthora cinnamomi]|nr:hypothetical protein ON010_g518 [Phytophthora cinnamomi]
MVCCCSSPEEISEKEGVAETRSGLAPRSARKCRDVFCCLLFVVYWIGMVVVAVIALQTGQPLSLIYGKDYNGNVCGEGNYSNARFTTYPRLNEDLMVAAAHGVSAANAKFFGVCVESCPMAGSKTCTYGDETCWVVAQDTEAAFFRCLPVASTNETILEEVCIDPKGADPACTVDLFEAGKCNTVCIYGGASYQSQNNAFRSGVDILVGTTGRVIDHIDRGNLRLHNCEFLILDEADTMLEMGFREDVQKVFTAMEQVENQSSGRRQTLLFSATIPKWVKDVADKYMQKDREYVNLVKDSDDQASTDVQHIAIPCHWQGRPTLLANLLGVYAKKDSRTIIFAETKKDCNELAVHPEIKTDCQVLHGDIAQEQRETTMKAFREGRLRLLIATDVAARGLDMNVDLVINSEPPRKMTGMADVDTYVHRSGRTGRAGKKGICITLYTNRQRDQLNQIERKIGNKFIMKGPPDQEDLIKASAAKALTEINNVDPSMIEIFQEQASELLGQMEPEKCLAAALACITGHTKPPRRTSLMSGVPDYVTVLFTSSNFIRAKGYVWNAVNRDIPENFANDIKQMTLTEDSMGACFDLPIAGLELVEKLIEEGGMNCPYSIPKTMPKLQQSAYQMRQQSFGGGRGGRGSGRGGGRGGRSRGGSGGRGRRY